MWESMMVVVVSRPDVVVAGDGVHGKFSIFFL